MESVSRDVHVFEVTENQFFLRYDKFDHAL